MFKLCLILCLTIFLVSDKVQSQYDDEYEDEFETHFATTMKPMANPTASRSTTLKANVSTRTVEYTTYEPIAEIQVEKQTPDVQTVLQHDLDSLMTKEKTECIGVDEVLKEISFIKNLLELKEAEWKVEIPNTTGVTPVPDHIPVWDVTDADFDVFPSMPEIDRDSRTDSQMKNNSTSNNVFESIGLFIDEYPVVFGIVVSIGVVLAFGCCFLCCHYSVCKCKKEHIMVIEHPHFFGTRTPTPLTNVSPILRRMSMYQEQYMEPIPMAHVRPMSNLPMQNQETDDESAYYEDPQVLRAQMRNQNTRMTTEI